MDVDSISATIRLIEYVCVFGHNKLCDSSGHCIDLDIHKYWIESGQLASWQGATLDLKSAYKQIAVGPLDLWSNIITVFDPTKQAPAMFIQHTLPFGATSSVILFNRIARFLWYLGCREMHAIWHNFYDDYPTLSPSVLSNSTKQSLELMLKLLGWQIAEDDKKSMSFAEQFTALGVVFDISDMRGLGSFVSNTPKRTKLVVDELTTILQNRHINKKTAEVLVGKLQFMESHCFGRIGRSHLRCLRKFVNASSALNEEDVEDIRFLVEWISKAIPKRISPARENTPLLFTDGACEFLGDRRIVTCGAILFPCDGSNPLCFGFEIDPVVSNAWALEGQKEQLVTEAEIYPVLIAMKTWQSTLKECKPIIFVDSNPAKHCLVRGTSNVSTCAKLIKSIYEEIDRLQTFPWFSRVPSKSNPADAPSRLNFDEAKLHFGAIQVSPIY
jgi:hypothetical protein